MDVFIKDIQVGSKNITVTCIVLDISPRVVIVKENREVRTLKIADSTACINLSLWDEPGALLQPGDIVRLTKCYAQIWRNCLTLYVQKNGHVEKISEFCMLFNETLDMSAPLPPNLALQQAQAASSNGNPNNGNNGPNNKGNNRSDRGERIDRDQPRVDRDQPQSSSRYNNSSSENKNSLRNQRVR